MAAQKVAQKQPGRVDVLKAAQGFKVRKPRVRTKLAVKPLIVIGATNQEDIYASHRGGKKANEEYWAERKRTYVEGILNLDPNWVDALYVDDTKSNVDAVSQIKIPEGNTLYIRHATGDGILNDKKLMKRIDGLLEGSPLIFDFDKTLIGGHSGGMPHWRKGEIWGPRGVVADREYVDKLAEKLRVWRKKHPVWIATRGLEDSTRQVLNKVTAPEVQMQETKKAERFTK
tara:strand:- start:29 stop:715 length:687 start_codon:yes stop_codon:yes gene_type:complete